jgi:hypothetical protein
MHQRLTLRYVTSADLMFFITPLLKEIARKTTKIFFLLLAILLRLVCYDFSAVERILVRSRQLVDVKKDDGFSAIHLASLNGHFDVSFFFSFSLLS